MTDSIKKTGDIIGKTVVNHDGVIIGVVAEVLFDVSTWQVTDLQIKIDRTQAKEFGLKTPLFGSLLVLVGRERVKSTSDQIVINIGKAELKDYLAERS